MIDNDDGMGWIQRAQLKKQKEKAIFDERLKVFELDDTRKAIALRVLENAPHKHFHGSSLFYVPCVSSEGGCEWKYVQ